LEQHRIELRRNHHETPIGRRVGTGERGAELHKQLVSVRVRPRYGNCPQVVVRLASGSVRDAIDHKPSNELVSLRSKIVRRAHSGLLNKPRQRLTLVNVVHLEREVIRLVNNQRLLVISEQIPRNRPVLRVITNSRILERGDVHRVTSASNLALVVTVDYARLSVGETVAQRFEQRSRPNLRNKVGDSHFWLSFLG